MAQDAQDRAGGHEGLPGGVFEGVTTEPRLSAPGSFPQPDASEVAQHSHGIHIRRETALRTQ